MMSMQKMKSETFSNNCPDMDAEKIIDALVTCYKITMERRTGKEVKVIVEDERKS